MAQRKRYNFLHENGFLTPDGLEKELEKELVLAFTRRPRQRIWCHRARDRTFLHDEGLLSILCPEHILLLGWRHGYSAMKTLDLRFLF